MRLRDEKPLEWVGTSLEDITRFPLDVKKTFGYELRKVQLGEMPESAKPLKGELSGVLELRKNHDGNTYRTVYIAKLKNKIYVLHCFQKRSSSGIATPKKEIDLIVDRLKIAVQDSKEGESK